MVLTSQRQGIKVKNQAAGLDALLEKQNQSHKKSARFIAITSGKGGVGKSTISANLAYTLWMMGYKIGVLDADIGLANLDLIFGVKTKATLLDVFKGSASIDDIVISIESGLYLIPGHTGDEILKYDVDVLGRINAQSALLDSLDFLIIDTGAGISKAVQSFLAASDYLVVITQPDPAALTDAYATIKLSTKHKNKIFMVVNQASMNEANAVFKRLQSVASANLGALELVLLGKISPSDTITQANRARKLFTRIAPQSVASASLQTIARNLLENMEQNVLLESESRFERFLRNILYRL